MKNLKYPFLLVVFLLSLPCYLFSQNYWTKLNGPYGGDAMKIQKGPSGDLLHYEMKDFTFLPIMPKAGTSCLKEW
ncbi:MAG: hypothetical protein IPL53_09605 [Ignavibacteria bacterium]|nr:hypothetical protein [Ignavibacteria bacterium]